MPVYYPHKEQALVERVTEGLREFVAIRLNNSKLERSSLVFPRTLHGCPASAELQLDQRSFYHLLLAMLQVASGHTITTSLPSHGLGEIEKDVDQVEAYAENLSRILLEMQEGIEDFGEGIGARMVTRRLKTKGLCSNTENR